MAVGWPLFQLSTWSQTHTTSALTLVATLGDLGNAIRIQKGGFTVEGTQSMDGILIVASGWTGPIRGAGAIWAPAPQVLQFVNHERKALPKSAASRVHDAYNVCAKM